MESMDVNELWNIFNTIVNERQFLPTMTPVSSSGEKQRWYLEFQDKVGFVLVATFENKAIAYCSVEQNEEEASYHVATVGLLVSKDFRDGGVGRELLKKAIEFAEDLSFKKLCLSTFAGNESAIHLYREVGFEIVGVRKNQFQIDSKFYDEIMMDFQLQD